MNYAIYPTHDTTLYERHIRRNSGIDQILELIKYVPSVPDVNGFYYDSIYNSRILMKFDTNHLANLIASNTVSRTAKYYLSLKATKASDLPVDYSIDVFAVSQSWANGNGHYNDYPEITNGASWRYRNGYYKGSGLQWINSSYSSGTTGSYATSAGGGTWFTGSNFYSSQNFNYSITPDIRINVTNIVHSWLSGSIANNGFIIKRTEEDEQSSEFKGDILFFSRDTHTIYIPKLEAVWDDSSFVSTGSLQEVSNDFSVNISNIKKSFRTNSKYRFRVKARDRFPNITYSTSSNYLDFKRLPVASYYAIQDSLTDDYIIPFDTGSTRLSIDSQGNYFNIDMNYFLPERFYKIVLKVIMDGGFTEHIIDDGFYFKVVR
jgi:hypothetical protein